MDARERSVNWARVAPVIGIFALALLVALLALASGHATAKTIPLTSDKNGKEGLIAGALGTAADGDIIALKGGVFYEENLTISKGVMLLGDGNSHLTAWSIHVTARNVTFHDMTIYMRSGVLRIDADNWTFEGTALQECLGYTCVRVESADGGIIRNSTFIGNNGDAIEINGSRNLTISDVYISASTSGIKLNGTKDAWLFGLRETQATIGVYMSWCNNLTIDHSILDTTQYGVLAANSTNLTIGGSLIMSNAGYLTNYGIYLAGDKNITVVNNTFDGNAAGLAAYKSSGVLFKWNSVYDNLEGVWSFDTGMTVVEKAIFENVRYSLNASTKSVMAANNYWGTTSVSDAKATVRGPTTLDPIKISDPTPDTPPVLLSPVPAITNGTEDQVFTTLLEVGPYFSDDTWYVQVWNPRPSSVRFTVIYNTEPKNVSIEVSETGTCAGTCKSAEGELKATTAINWYGTASVRLRATDWRGKHVDSNIFTITFSPVNDRPVVDIEGIAKNSEVDLLGGEERQFNITVYDDSLSVIIQVKIDDGQWIPVEQSTQCKRNNATKLKGMPYCARTEVTLKASGDLDVGMHNISFKACDGERCSDEVSTGKFDFQIYDMGSTGKSFSPTGVALALVLLVLIAIVLVAMASPKKQKEGQKEERPVAAASDEEE